MNQSETHARIEQLIAQRNVDAAAADCIQLVKIHADDAKGWQLLSEVSLLLNQNRMAVNAALKAVDLAPENTDFLLHLAQTYAGFSAWGATRKVLARLDEKSQSLSAAGLSSLAMLHFQGLNHERAEQLYQQVLDADPDNAQVKCNLAAILRFNGKLDEAAGLLESVVASNPQHAEACSALAHVKKHRLDDGTLDSINACLAKTENAKNMLPAELAALLYAKGKVLEDGGCHKDAFTAYLEGAAHKKSIQTFTTEQEIGRVNAMQTLVSANAFPALPATNEAGPIFVVGMPRTGTTVVERILGAHTSVTAGGELNFLPMTLLEASGQSWFKGPEGITAEVLGQVARVSHKAIGERYMALSRDLLACEGVFTDKLPLNALFVPVILAAIPDAKIILLERNAMDTAFSNFKMLFTRGYDYSYSLDDIAAYLPVFQHMTAQWQETYRERLHTVNYEMLIANPETTICNMLNFCGLPWEPACLQFHKQTAVTQTASASQVKEPLHNRFVGQWRNYQDSLSQLKTTLGSEGITPLTEEDTKW